MSHFERINDAGGRSYREQREEHRDEHGVGFRCFQNPQSPLISHASIAQTGYAATAMSFLIAFGLGGLAHDLLATDGAHDLGNLLSLENGVHADFDRLNLWFESTDEPNHYTVCVCDPGNEEYLRKFGNLHADGDRLSVTFSSRHQSLRLPDPRLLALHAACARVAHMSGAAEAFDKFECDVEDTRVLAFEFDGSSARLLDHFLTPFSVVPGAA